MSIIADEQILHAFKDNGIISEKYEELIIQKLRIENECGKKHITSRRLQHHTHKRFKDLNMKNEEDGKPTDIFSQHNQLLPFDEIHRPNFEYA